jgi:hypothetical protein
MRAIFGPSVSDAEDAQADSLLDLRILPNALDQASYGAMFDQVLNLGSDKESDVSHLTRWLTTNVYETRNRGGHFYYMARAVVYSAAAQTAGMDYAPDVLRLPIGALAFRQTTHALSKVLYDAVVEKVHSEVEALALLGMPVALFIPPLTAKILSESASAQDFPSQILALRDRFAGFRDTYNKFLLLLKDPSITMKDKIAAKERLFKDITGVIERGEAGIRPFRPLCKAISLWFSITRC